MIKDELTPVPFSHRVKVAQVSHNPLEFRIEADEAARAGLAKLWGIISVEALTADLQVRRFKKDGVKVFGTVHAEVTQACVVSLDPVPEVIDEEVDETLVPETSALARIPANDAGELLIDPDGPDFPGVFTGDTVDIGAVAAEIVAMVLDPYPRKPGVAFEAQVSADLIEDKKPNPFAVLKGLKGDK